MEHIDFDIRGELITLDALLKATGLAGSGGAAKVLIAAGKVLVDGREELRRGAKLRPGQVVAVLGVRVRLRAAEEGATPTPPTEPQAGG